MFTTAGKKATKCATMRSVVFVWHANVIGLAGPEAKHMH